MQPVRCGWLLIRSQLKGVVQGRGQKLHLNFYAEKLALPHLSVRWAHLVHVLLAGTKAWSHCTFCPHSQKYHAQMIIGILNHVCSVGPANSFYRREKTEGDDLWQIHLSCSPSVVTRPCRLRSVPRMLMHRVWVSEWNWGEAMMVGWFHLEILSSDCSQVQIQFRC